MIGEAIIIGIAIQEVGQVIAIDITGAFDIVGNRVTITIGIGASDRDGHLINVVNAQDARLWRTTRQRHRVGEEPVHVATLVVLTLTVAVMLVEYVAPGARGNVWLFSKTPRRSSTRR